jgi:hypothetical protein
MAGHALWMNIIVEPKRNNNCRPIMAFWAHDIMKFVKP